LADVGMLVAEIALSQRALEVSQYYKDVKLVQKADVSVYSALGDFQALYEEGDYG
ncbi:hypothetical protein DL93DRAFT_2086492, partial [Clavulina sp. PMI_390]